MADVYVNALTTISDEPTSTDSMVCVNRNTNEGQIIDYSLLADKILSKLTSKQFSTLTTTSKLIPGAINEHETDIASLAQRYEVKSASYTGTTNSGGLITGGASDFGIAGASIILAAYMAKGSYGTYRHVDVSNYGSAGFGLQFFQGSGYASQSAVSSSSVTCTIYYI